MADSSSRTQPPQPTSPLATFSYPPLSHAYLIHLRRARASQRQSPLPSNRLILASVCIVVLVALLTGSIWLLMSSYSTKIVNMERNFSYLYTANSVFVDKIIVSNRLGNEGPIVYGFSTPPKLDKEINWTDVYDAVVQSQGHQEWGFWLNKGSQVDVIYNISDPSMVLLLVVLKGEESLHKWDSDQSLIDYAALMVTAQGAGALAYDVETDDRYYFGFQNSQLEDVKVNVALNLHSKVHRNDNFKSQCHLTASTCAVHLDYLGSTALLLTTPQGIEHRLTYHNMQSLLGEDFLWSVDVIFEQRWLTYLIVWGAMAIVMLILLMLCKPNFSDLDTPQDATISVQENSPLMVSLTEDEKVTRTKQQEASSVVLSDDDLEATEGSESFLCIICFDQQRNCFFDPCGHCATCYTCSMKIAKEKKALCPLCRKPIRYIRKIIVS